MTQDVQLANHRRAAACKSNSERAIVAADYRWIKLDGGSSFARDVLVVPDAIGTIDASQITQGERPRGIRPGDAADDVVNSTASSSINH